MSRPPALNFTEIKAGHSSSMTTKAADEILATAGFVDVRVLCSFYRLFVATSSQGTAMGVFAIDSGKAGAIEITQFVTHPDHRGKGVGERMMLYIKDQTKSRDLIVYADSDQAKRFYLGQRFTAHPTRADWYIYRHVQ